MTKTNRPYRLGSRLLSRGRPRRPSTLRGFVPFVESLEHRWVPSGFSFNGFSGAPSPGTTILFKLTDSEVALDASTPALNGNPAHDGPIVKAHAVSGGALAVGDQLYGIFNITTINSRNGFQQFWAASATQAITGEFWGYTAQSVSNAGTSSELVDWSGGNIDMFFNAGPTYNPTTGPFTAGWSDIATNNGVDGPGQSAFINSLAVGGVVPEPATSTTLQSTFTSFNGAHFTGVGDGFMTVTFSSDIAFSGDAFDSSTAGPTFPYPGNQDLSFKSNFDNQPQGFNSPSDFQSTTGWTVLSEDPLLGVTASPSPAINIVKLTNGTNNDTAPGLQVPVGTPITWTYLVTAAGSSEPIKNVVVTDDNGTPGNTADDFHPSPVLGADNVHNIGDTNNDGLLDPTETWQYTANGGPAQAGQYTNNSVVTGNGNSSNTPVTAQNPDNYFGTLSVGDFVWNDVNVNGIQDSSDLSSNGINGVKVDLLDSHGTQIATTTTGNNPVGGAPGYYQFSGLAPGSYTVVIDSSNFNSGGPLFGFVATPSNAPGSTTANDSNGSPAPVTLTTANDETIDFGYFVPNPKIQILKETNGTNNDTAPGLQVPVGTPITWTYFVTATGSNEPIKNVVVTDDNGTPGNTADDFHPTPVLGADNVHNIGDTNKDGLLDPTETWQYTASGGPAQVGQYTNNSVVTGNGNVSNTPVTAQNPDNYFGTSGSPDLVVVKTADASSVAAGNQIGFTITITNPGGAAATNVQLQDKLPPGSGGDIFWKIDAGTGNPGLFQIVGPKGSQVLESNPVGGFTLPAGQSVSVHITSPTNGGDISGGAVGVQSGVNPIAYLSGAGDYAVLYTGTGGHNLQITNVTIGGNVGVGGTGKVQFNGPGAITGRLDFAAANTGQFGNNNGSNVGPASVNYSVAAVTTALNTVTTLNSSLAGLGTNLAINGNQTINESAGQLDTVNGVTYRVFNVTSYSENDGKLVTINGDGSGDPVVFNFGFNSNVNLGGDVALTGNGLSDDKVIWNFTTSGKAVSLNNNASSFPNVAFHGIILAPNDAISLVNANLSGRAFGGDSADMQIVSGVTIHAPVLNTATVTATNVTFDSDDTSSAGITITGSGFKPPQALLAAGATPTGAQFSLGTVTAGVYYVSVDGLADGALGASELARVEDALATLNGELTNLGVSFVEVDASNHDLANVHVAFADTSLIGGAEQGVLGVTLGSDIILINGWDWYLGSDPGQVGTGQYDLQTIATHELGHAIGLGHSADPSSVMYPYLSAGEAKRDLTANDLIVIQQDQETAPEPLLAAGYAAPGVRAAQAAAGSAVTPAGAWSITPSVPGTSFAATLLGGPGAALVGQGLRGLSVQGPAGEQVISAVTAGMLAGQPASVTATVPATVRNSVRPEMPANDGSDALLGGTGDDLLLGSDGGNALVGGYASSRTDSGRSDTAMDTVMAGQWAAANGAGDVMALTGRLADDFFQLLGSRADADAPATFSKEADAADGQ
jgi:uncharacterized repeat protein (TIGR01451 family)